MANTLRIKRRASGAAGAPAGLENAELAFNEVDNTLYYGKGTGGAGGTATTVIPIGGDGAFVGLTGDQTIAGTKTFSSTIGASITGNSATATALATARNINGVAFDGTADITVADATKLALAGGTMTGAITFAAGQTWPTFNQSTTGNAATATKLATARTLAVSGDATGSASFDGSANATLATTLATVNSNVGTFGSATQIPTFTVNAKGLVTAVSVNTISTSFGIAGNTGTDTVNTGETLTFTGTAGQLAAAVTNNTVTLSLAAAGTAGTYTKVTTDAQGRVTSGTTLAAGDIPTLTAAKISDFDTQVRTSRLDQLAAPTAAVSVNSQRITNVATPTQDTDAVNKAYVDAARLGLDVKDSVKAATTANITLSGLQNVDGITLVAGDRVLVKDQTTASANGIYLASATAWTRAEDFVNGTVSSGAFVFVEQGTAQADSGWVLSTDGAITVGTTNLAFAQFSGAGQISAGTGLTKTGNTINAVGTSGRIVANADSIDLATVGTAGTYRSVTTDAYGRVTAGTNPTTLAGYGITDAQPLDATLTAFAGVTTAANQLVYATGSDTFTTTSLTAFARTILDDADAAATRSTLGLVIGTNVQAYDADLAAIAALAVTDGNFIVGNGTSWTVESGATARTSLGLGSMATQNSNSVTITGGTIDGITFDMGVF